MGEDAGDIDGQWSLADACDGREGQWVTDPTCEGGYGFSSCTHKCRSGADQAKVIIGALVILLACMGGVWVFAQIFDCKGSAKQRKHSTETEKETEKEWWARIATASLTAGAHSHSHAPSPLYDGYS